MSPKTTRLLTALFAVLLVLFGARAAFAEPDPHDDHPPAAGDPHADDAHQAEADDHDDHGAESAPDPEADIDFKDAPPATDHKAYGAFLRMAIQKARPRVLAKLEEKMETGQGKTMGRLSLGLTLFSLCGFFLLFRPLFLLKKYPGRGGQLFKWSFVSSLLFFFTVNVFSIVLFILRGAQGAAGKFTNPQVAVVEAAFDVLERNADDLAVIGPKLIEPSIHKLSSGDASFVVVLLENVKTIKGDVQAILAIAKAMKALDGVFALIPVILTIVAIVTFALSAKDTLLSIVRLPETVLDGGGAGVVVKNIFRRVKNELLATFCLIGVLLLVTICGGLALRAAVEPAVESFLSTFFLAVMYLQTAKVSSVVLFGSLALAALVLVLNIGVVLAGSSAALGKAHKIFQQKFHDGVPLSAHKTFWWRAPLSLALCFLFPLVYELVAEKGVEALLMHTLESENPNFAAALIGAPALLVGGFLLLFTLTYGVHSMLFLFRYSVKKKPAEEPASAYVQPAPMPVQPAPIAPNPFALQQPVPEMKPVSSPPPPLAQQRPDLAAKVRESAKMPSAPPPPPRADDVPRVAPAVDPLAIFDRLKAGRPKEAPPPSPSTDDVATIVFERAPDDTIKAPRPAMGRYAQTMLDGSRRG